MTKSINYHEFLKASTGRIREVRKKLSLRQVDFAKQLGISQSFLSYVESDKRRPSIELLRALLVVFNVDLHWIMTGKGKMFNQDQDSTVDEPGFKGILSRIPMAPDVIDMIKSLEVPIMRHAMLSKYYHYLLRYEDTIREYYEKKEEESNSHSGE